MTVDPPQMAQIIAGDFWRSERTGRIWRPVRSASEQGQVTAKFCRRDGTADKTVEPVVIRVIWQHLPFIDRATATSRFDAVFAGEVIGKQSVPGG